MCILENNGLPNGGVIAPTLGELSNSTAISIYEKLIEELMLVDELSIREAKKEVATNHHIIHIGYLEALRATNRTQARVGTNEPLAA